MVQAGNRLNRGTSRWSPRQLTRRALVACLPQSRLIESLPGTGAIYLTFDDGPHPEYTPRLLDLLRDQGAEATFFVVGRECERHPKILQRIVGEGHAIGNHTQTHLDARVASRSDYQRDVRQGVETIRTISGTSPALFRPPYGRLSIASMVSLARERQTIVLWNVDVRDYAARDAEEVRSRFAENSLTSGDVVLMHDTFPYALSVLPELMQKASLAGLSFRSLGDLAANGDGR
jgi:peptidoglycan/xylan/chitin deacetylase (PgdA/CDA1 family)